MIQYHATLEEIVQFSNSIQTESKCIVTLMSLKPFKLSEVSGDLSINNKCFENDVRIIFTQSKLLNHATSPNHFYDLNPGVIDIDVGYLTENGLRESLFSFMSDEQDKIDFANILTKKLKKITKAGIIAVNPVSGAEAKVRSHRYTSGAKSMYDQGVKIIPLGGGLFYKL